MTGKLLKFASAMAASVVALPVVCAHAQVFQTLPTLPGMTASGLFNPHISANGAVIVGTDDELINGQVVHNGFVLPYNRTTDQFGATAQIPNTLDTSGQPPWVVPAGVSDPNASAFVVAGRASVYQPPFPGNETNEAFAWTAAGGMRGLGFLPGWGAEGGGSSGFGLNAGVWNSVDQSVTVPGGAVVVGSADATVPPTPAGTTTEAFRWTAATGIFGLGFLAGDDQSEALAVSADGLTVVGGSCSDTGPTFVCQPFKWTTSAINNQQGTMNGLGSLSGYFVTEASDVSADGSVIVGSACNATNVQGCQPFRWTAATGLVGLGFNGEGFAVNAAGNIAVGAIMDSSGDETDAYLWTGGAAQSLTTRLTAHGIDLSGWVLTAATGISADGHMVVGRGTLNGNPALWSVHLPGSHDFEGSGKSDVLWRDSGGDLAMWFMSGNQIAASSVIGSVATNWSVVGQRDFNADGDADILWRDNLGNLDLWLMHGESLAGTANLGNVPTNWSVYGTGDLNGDGNSDILWRDGNSGAVAIWLMNGTQVSSVANLGTVPLTWTIVGDDDKGNVFWRDSGGNVAIWQVNGSRVVNSVLLGNVPTNWVIAGLGDFDGNGATDILWRDSSSGAVAIWFMNGTQVQSVASVATVTSDWSIAQTGDYDGDGMSDVFWVNSSGQVAVWFMRGGRVASVASLGSVGTSWLVQAQNAE